MEREKDQKEEYTINRIIKKFRGRGFNGRTKVSSKKINVNMGEQNYC